LTIDFTALNAQAQGASFTSLLGDQWSAVTNAEDPAALRFAAVLLTGNTGLTQPTHLGTLRWSMTSGTETADIAFQDVNVGTMNMGRLSHTLSSRTTEGDGSFAFTLDAGQGYALGAERPATDSGSAISSADALAALRIAVGLNPNADPDGPGPLEKLAVSPYQIMAADVNNSGTVTSADALAILRMAVKLSTALPQEWFFVEETRDFWDEGANGGQGAFALTRQNARWEREIQTEVPEAGEVVNLVGVMKGDVNGSWVPPTGSLDLDVLNPTYFQDLAALIGVPTDQWGI
jgi:hypothetical protein